MMNNDVKQQILSKIEEYDTIIISRHIRPDGDAVGSTMGFAGVLRLTYPEKRIFLDNEDYSEYVAFLGDEGEHPSPSDYENALVIVLDTGVSDRISNKKFSSGKELIKIDHHIDDKPYGDISWVEDERSSACEMVADFCMTFRDTLKIDSHAASCLFTGMVTDTGRFRFRGTDSRTHICAAFLLEQNIDTENIFAHLYIDSLQTTRFRAAMTRKIRFTKNGVAWLNITKSTIKKYRLTAEEASESVSLMSSIKGSLIWIAFISSADGSTRVRLRSRFVEVQPLAMKYHGGGHACASGATVYSVKERNSLIKDADALLEQYKKDNDDWI